jgi:hypothetical protein
LSSLKKLQRQVKKLTIEIAQRSKNVEVMLASSTRDKSKKVKALKTQYGERHGWVYVMEPYKFQPFNEDPKKTQERVKKYMSSLGEEFGPHGSTF